MNNIYTVGLTGPSGAGKSTVAKLFASHGIKIIDADKIAREVMAPASPALAELAGAFGEDILKEDGGLDRKLLAERAFKNKRTQKILNDITHPLIVMQIRRKIKELRDSGEKIAVIDAPLLFESGIDIMCDKTIAVIAASDARLLRITERDNLSENAARLRMSAQNEEYFYISRADTVIENNAGTAELTAAAAEAEKGIRSSANETCA